MQVKVYVKEMKQRGRKWGVVLFAGCSASRGTRLSRLKAKLALKR